MRILRAIVSIFIILYSLLGCSQSKDKKIYTENLTTRNLGAELIKNGFLQYANQLKIDTLKDEIEKHFYIYNEETYKFAHIDAEELAEFNFEFFLPQINKMLEKRNVSLTIKTAENYKNTFKISLNGEEFDLYLKKEIENYKFWESAPQNFFREVNKILKKKRKDEKFYLLYGGNDLSVLLLTENQFEIINRKYINEPNEIPYLP